MMKLRAFFIALMAVGGMLLSQAQNLTASQMNIYFGSPKKATVTTPQGVAVTEFDKEGRITSMTQGNMKMTYDWNVEPGKVIASMYQGPNLSDSGEIIVSKMTPEILEYNIPGMGEMEFNFKKNGAVDRSVMKTPQMEIVSVYLYKNPDDVYPYAIENEIAGQKITVNVSVDKTDAMGNAIEYTQESMGQSMTSKMDLEYY